MKHDKRIADCLTVLPEWSEKRVYARLLGYPDPTNCWTWPLTSGRYGLVTLPKPYRASVLVHRLVWIDRMGGIDPNLELDHAGPTGCKVRLCANPAHIQPVSHRHNTVVTGTGPAAIFARTTHCPKGHPLTSDNLVNAVHIAGRRGCRTCHREKARSQHAAIRDASKILGLSQAAYKAQYGHSEAIARSILGG